MSGGRYDELCERLLVALDARAVCLGVVRGASGSGFSLALDARIASPREARKDVVRLLRSVAAGIEAELQRETVGKKGN